jgi:hypothetical protein
MLDPQPTQDTSAPAAILSLRQKCLETRKTADGLIRRRWLMQDGSRLWTLELPESVVLAMRNFVRRRMRQNEHGRQISAAAEQRKALVLDMVAKGIKREAIACAAGCSLARVYQIVAEAKKKGGAA